LSDSREHDCILYRTLGNTDWIEYRPAGVVFTVEAPVPEPSA